VSTSLAPTERDERIGMLDATRGIAVLGILLMNITGFGLPQSYDDPTNWGGYQGINLTTWRIAALFFEGTMRGLFTLLFGAGALLFLQRHAARHTGLLPADLYFRRTMWLIFFGLVNAYALLWSGDILYYYGVTGLLLFVFRNVAPQAGRGLGGHHDSADRCDDRRVARLSRDRRRCGASTGSAQRRQGPVGS